MLKGFVSGEEKDIVRIPMKGRNILPDSGWASGQYRSGVWELTDSRMTSDYIPIGGGLAYALSINNGTELSWINLNYFDSSKQWLGSRSELGMDMFSPTAQFLITPTFPSNAAYLRVTVRGYNESGSPSIEKIRRSNVQVNLGSSPLPYEPYGYQEGWEVRDNQDRLIWGREDELQTATGTLPFKGYALPVKVKSLLGNAVQNGTPAPDNIVVPEFCGKLVDDDWTIPLTNAGQTVTIYLGEVPTVRRVRKLVLDGTENWSILSGKLVISRPSSCRQYSPVMSTHFIQTQSATNPGEMYVGGSYINFNYDGVNDDVTGWKAYLASEYAAGHPVTVWYVLATQTTGIVNEPLCKISTYADELTTVQVHGLSAPLYGIGDYKDTLNLSTGVVTRKVKKLVLTGGEAWNQDSVDDNRTVCNLSLLGVAGNYGYCSHIEWKSPYQTTEYDRVVWNNAGGGRLYISLSNGYLSSQTVDAFKAYLAAQYQAGTPVTIWYVLNTPDTNTVTVPTGMTGEIEGYLTQVSTPTPTNRSVPKWNGVEETGGTYAVTVYIPPEIPTTTGQNTLTVDTSLAPSSLTIKGHIKELT